MITELILLVFGIFVVWASAELVIKASQIIAGYFGISETFVGLTILSIGTSLPELGTHIVASINILKGIDVSDIAVATNVGSNMVQITVVLGLVGLFMKIHANKEFLKKDYLVMLGSIILLFLFSLDHKISRLEGFIFVALYLWYLWSLAKVEHFAEKIHNNHTKRKVIAHFLILPLGIFALLMFSNIVVGSAQNLAEQLMISQSMIGALIIGVGTCMPELAASIVAISRKSSGMSLGILVGSNITNPLFCIGIGAMISNYFLGWRVIFYDIPFWFFASVMAFIFLLHKKDIVRWQAITLIGLFAVYAGIRIMFIG